MLRLVGSCTLLAVLTLLVGCGATRNPAHYLKHYRCSEPTVEEFTVCRKAGCRELSTLGYTPAEWQSITAIFEPAPESPDEERERLRIAIAAMEQIIGEKNGTHVDRPRNRREGDNHGAQLDCIAEATNTTVALTLFQNNGILRYHTVGYPQHRGFIHGRLPHNTAIILENETGDAYAIDSWFHANGELPEVVTLAEWKAGFSPN
ncbi:MAG: hypothetical protein ACPGJU_06920 [Coraliomargarita sp.]